MSRRIQAVSPLFFWKREKRDTKRIQVVSPYGILFGKREKRMKKMNSTLLFSVKEQGLETRKLRKLLAKEEEEEVQEDVQKVV